MKTNLLIDRNILNAWMNKFINNEPLEDKIEIKKENVTESFDNELFDIQLNYIVDLKTNNYITLNNEFETDNIYDIQSKTEIVNNKVNEIVLYKNKNLKPNIKLLQLELDYKIFLSGSPNTGKSIIIKKILDKIPGLKVINIYEIISFYISKYKLYLASLEEDPKKKKEKLEPQIEEFFDNMKTDEVFNKNITNLYESSRKNQIIDDNIIVYILINRIKNIALSFDDNTNIKGKDQGATKGKKNVVSEDLNKGFIVNGFPMNINQSYLYEK